MVFYVISKISFLFAHFNCSYISYVLRGWYCLYVRRPLHISNNFCVVGKQSKVVHITKKIHFEDQIIYNQLKPPPKTPKLFSSFSNLLDVWMQKICCRLINIFTHLCSTFFHQLLIIWHKQQISLMLSDLKLSRFHWFKLVLINNFTKYKHSILRQIDHKSLFCALLACDYINVWTMNNL